MVVHVWFVNFVPFFNCCLKERRTDRQTVSWKFKERKIPQKKKFKERRFMEMCKIKIDFLQSAKANPVLSHSHPLTHLHLHLPRLYVQCNPILSYGGIDLGTAHFYNCECERTIKSLTLPFNLIINNKSLILNCSKTVKSIWGLYGYRKLWSYYS